MARSKRPIPTRRRDEDSTDPNDVWRSFLEPVNRMSRDMRAAAATLSASEARYLVDSYYIAQENRKRAGGQERALEKSGEPHSIISWLFDQSDTLEKQIKGALDVYTDNHVMGNWMRCAPGTAEVWAEGRKRVRISELHNGDGVISFNRHHARLTRPRPVTVGMRPYQGELIGVQTQDHFTEVTPNHRWLTRFARRDTGMVVYLMQAGDRFRVGRTGLFNKRTESFGNYMRLGVQTRARGEQASVWILKVFSTDREAAVYEHFVSAHYGLTETCFKQNRPGGSRGLDQDEIDALFAMFDAADMRQRATQCLRDHGRYIEAPLWSWSGDMSKQSPTNGLETHAANLIPEIMQVPVPTAVYAGVDWLDITELKRRQFDGPVYSLDVAEHHKYIQDGVITCNSIYGIGPVLSAGLLAHIDMNKAPTCGHIWAFAGWAGDNQKPWEKGKKRPFNADFRTLCWKVGDSFRKFHNRPDCYYGQKYYEYKLRKIAQNESGGYKARAAQQVREASPNYKKIDAYKLYNVNGLLSPGHIDDMASRWAVKLFLAHLHEEWHLRHFGRPSPSPYPIAFLGHAHVIPPGPAAKAAE